MKKKKKKKKKNTLYAVNVNTFHFFKMSTGEQYSLHNFNAFPRSPLFLFAMNTSRSPQNGKDDVAFDDAPYIQ